MSFNSKTKTQKFVTLRFLHLSDFHFPNVKFRDSDSISIDKENGYQSPHTHILNEIYNVLDSVHFILISGDFTTSSDLEGFDKCLSFVNEKFSHRDIKIYSVFGNHDLIRRKGKNKFDEFLRKAQEYSCVEFIGPELCERKELTIYNSKKIDLDLILINSCKYSSDKPIIPGKLKKCITEPLSKLFNDDNIFANNEIDGKVAEVWDRIKLEIENETLIDDISFQDSDYTTLRDKLENLGSIICLSHYNLVSFIGIDKLNSFFSDQGMFRDIFVNHKNTVIYLSGHTHTQEYTVIENPEDYTNKLICITSPPLFKIESNKNGFNIVDVIFRENENNTYKPVGCKILKFKGDVGSAVDCKRIRFSRSLADVKFTDDERIVISTLRKLSQESRETEGYVRMKKLFERLKQHNVSETEKFNSNYLHEILMYLWWIGVIDEYSAMKREDESEARLIDYVGGILCLPLSH